MSRIEIKWPDDDPIYGRVSYMGEEWRIDTILMDDKISDVAPRVRMYLDYGDGDRHDGKPYRRLIKYPALDWDRSHGDRPGWADIDDGVSAED